MSKKPKHVRKAPKGPALYVTRVESAVPEPLTEEQVLLAALGVLTVRTMTAKEFSASFCPEGKRR